jgi:hypothetical protein
MIDPMTRQRIHIHREAGLPQEVIAGLTGTSVSTVQRVLEEPMPTPSELQNERMARPHGGRPPVTATEIAEKVAALLADQRELPTTEVLRIAKTTWKYPGSRASFFRLVRRLRPAAVPEPMVRFEGLPGEFAQFDFGEAKLVYADGKRETVHVFVGRLKFSRYLQVLLVPNEQAETLIRSVVACCCAWGGSPLAWVFDNPTTVRLSKANEQVRLHPYLQYLAGELRVAVELCAPRSGNQKGSVERGVGWVKNSFLLVRSFLDRADVEAQLAAWLREVNEERPCDATKEIPARRLEREADRLRQRPIPWLADEFPIRESLTVTPVATVQCCGTPYQTDPKAIGTVATVFVRRHTIEISTVRGTRHTHQRRDGQRTVQRLPGQGSEVLKCLHGERKRNYFQRECILALGADAARFLEELIHRYPDGGWVPTVRKLFDLLEQHGGDRLRAAFACCLAQDRCDLFAVTAAIKETA